MSIGEIMAVLPPPAQPLEADGDFGPVEERVGLTLPEDYKQFIRRYGTGYVDDFLIVFNPFAANPNVNLVEEIFGNGQLKALADLASGAVARELGLEDSGEELPYPLYPEPGGLLPWATTDNGETCHWLTAGPPEAWTVVVDGGRDPAWDAAPLDCTGFLAAVLERRLQVEQWPYDEIDWPSDHPQFQPISGG